MNLICARHGTIHRKPWLAGQAAYFIQKATTVKVVNAGRSEAAQREERLKGAGEASNGQPSSPGWAVQCGAADSRSSGAGSKPEAM